MNKEQVFTALGIKERHLDDLVNEGKFPRGVKIGKQLEWLPEVVDAWLLQAFAQQREWAANVRSQTQAAPSGQPGIQRPGGAAGGVGGACAQPARAAVENSAGGGVADQNPRSSTALRAAGVRAPVRLAN